MRSRLLVVVAATLWGTTGTAQALGPDGVNPLAVGWTRMLVGAAGLVALAVVRRAAPAPLARSWLAVAVVSVSAYQLTFFGGVRLAGVALGTAVGIGSAPIWGGLVDWRLAGWRPSPRWLLAVVIALAGAALLASEPTDADRPGLGLVLGAGAGLSYAVYAYALQQLARVGDADRVAATVMVGAALVLAPFGLLAGMGPLWSGSGAAMALWLGLAATTGSYACFTRGVREVPVSSATVLTLAEPITAVALGITVVGESLTTVAVAGVALLLTGVTVAATGAPPTAGLPEVPDLAPPVRRTASGDGLP